MCAVEAGPFIAMGRRRRAERPLGIPFAMPTLIEPFNMAFVKALMTEYICMTLFLVRNILPKNLICGAYKFLLRVVDNLAFLLLHFLLSLPLSGRYCLMSELPGGLDGQFMAIATVTYQCQTPDAVKKVTTDGSMSCELTFGRVLNIAWAFGISIFILVYIAASFRCAVEAANPCPGRGD